MMEAVKPNEGRDAGAADKGSDMKMDPLENLTSDEKNSFLVDSVGTGAQSGVRSQTHSKTAEAEHEHDLRIKNESGTSSFA